MTVDKQSLLKIAESVDREEWAVLDNGDDEYQVIVSGSLERGATYRSYRPVANEVPEQEIAAFIAAFNPATVLALLDDLDVKEEQRANWFQMARRLGKDLDAAERCIAELDERLIEYAGIATREARRVAELEARKVTLPAQRFCPGEYVGSVLWAETEIWNKAISACAVAVRAAGIKVKES